MKKIIFGILAMSLSTMALAENKYGVGLGVGVSNSIYKGADDKAYPVPLLDINYGNFYVKGITPGYYLFRGEDLSVSAFIDPMAGFPIKAKDMGVGYTNIDDRDFQAMVGLRADLNTGIAGIRTGASVQFGEHGSEAKISAFRPYNINDKFTLVPGIYVKGFSGDYTDYYFGVTSDEVNRSKFDNLNREYKADAAASVGANLTAEYKWNEKFSLIGILGVEKFSSEVTDSPIVNEDPLFIASVGAKYYF
ncbi:MipA/OmpV family protein [Candidatus Cetobacterium colombiensis]|uniref:MipA/OmpV family protein n=1 Tax=Candidatus Cetobacterium colombiensis TaxID=3073100 RepID=A0ABU4WBW6_9FUSO|nr:MipA/OmpV family protein [Candidatus Cetobacterium colombiensis]MDX8335978.1 MipA/OmpV family protein [Candidatus Cetobacterium colombiensis]